MSIKKAVLFLLKLGVTVLLFMVLFRPEQFGLKPDVWGGDITLRGLIEEIRAVEARHIVFWLSFATVVKLAGMLAGVLRWRLLLRGQGLRLPFWYMVQSWFIGRLIGIFLPGTLGLDGYRLYDSSLYTGQAIKCTTVIVIEKLIGFIALTLLVFVTFPMGYQLLNFKLPMLAATLFVFGSFVAISLFLLLNPRVIQVLAAVLPVPGKIRHQVNKVGSSVAAYGGNRSTLLLAVFFGILVHVGTCLMYFGTMSAIRAENTTIFDIFFTCPLMIWGTVLGPSVGGEGIREVVFTTVLGSTTGTLKAFLIAHLGWWIGEVVPFLIGVPIFILRSRKTAAQDMKAAVADAHKQAAAAEPSLDLTPEEVLDYRVKLGNVLVAGVAGGLLAGALVGLGEAAWVARELAGLDELAAYWWGPLVYGLAFAGVGLGVAAALSFIFLLLRRFPRPQVSFGLTLGGCAAGAALILGLWRLKRDVLMGHSPTLQQSAIVLGVAVAIGLVLAFAGMGLTWAFRLSHRKSAAIAVGVFLLLVLAGIPLSRVKGDAEGKVFAPPARANGPNMIFIAADALRADYLPLYSPDATVATPNLVALAQDGVLFTNAFAHASWTKPSFATLFSGVYPEAHTATSKTAVLPDSLVTFPEALQEAGYYTQGFANNPNITATFGFDQGYTSYVDLKPNLYFGATPSAAKLTIYEVLRRVKQKVDQKLFKGRMVVTDFYQPAEEVTKLALNWLDDGVPQEAPFFLFLHYMDPHDPFMDWEKPGVGYARVRMEHPDPDEFLDPMRHAYNLEIAYMDKYLGGLIAGLKERGLYEKTLIVFTADHGEEFFDHEGWWHGQTLYDELVKIPLVAKLPGNRLAGTVNTDLARHIDVGPTFLHFAGASKPEAMAGQSFFGEGDAMTNSGIGYIYAESDFEGNDLQAVRTKDAKIIRANEDNPRGHAPIEFYDMAADPSEQNNIAGQGDVREPTLFGVMEEMQAHITENAAEPALVEKTDEELMEQMKALGYMN